MKFYETKCYIAEREDGLMAIQFGTDEEDNNYSVILTEKESCTCPYWCFGTYRQQSNGFIDDSTMYGLTETAFDDYEVWYWDYKHMISAIYNYFE